jgi:hypothetical protein
MAVNIDELQVETQAPAAPSGAAAAGATPQPKSDLKAEIERLHVRELRVRAD